MGLYRLFGPSGRQVDRDTGVELIHDHGPTAEELPPLTTGAVLGAVYTDGGMEAVASVLGDYVDFMLTDDSYVD